MSDPLPTEKQFFRLAVVTCNVAHMVHAGGDVVREVRTFPIPQEIRDYIIEARKQPYTQVTLMLDVTEAHELYGEAS